MINKNINTLKDSIQNADDITQQRKAELIAQLDEMQAKIPVAEEAELKQSSDSMKHLVGEFETNHPELADLINRISMMLANIGL
jgi:phage-related protein